MPRHSDTEHCSKCDKYCSRELLTVKHIMFADLPDRGKTSRGKIQKMRTVAYLCEKCRDEDPDWNIEAYTGPGHTSQALERVRNSVAGK